MPLSDFLGPTITLRRGLCLGMAETEIADWVSFCFVDMMDCIGEGSAQHKTGDTFQFPRVSHPVPVPTTVHDQDMEHGITKC
jgi:hypothetical protein